jgi:hypothetical protein
MLSTLAQIWNEHVWFSEALNHGRADTILNLASEAVRV